MKVKLKGKYVEGYEPETLAGKNYSTFRAALSREKKRGEVNGPAHGFQRQAEAIAQKARGEEDEPESTLAASPPASAALETEPEPAPQKPPVPAVPPAAQAPQPVPSPVDRVATVNVTLKSRVDQHRHLKLMSVYTGRSVQDLVSTAVDEFITRNPIKAA